MLPPRVPSRPFTWTEAQAAGLSRERLTDLVATGEVRRVLQGVYQPASLPDTLENRCRAVALVMRPFVVLCDRTAAWLHGVDTFSYRELEILPPLDTFVLSDLTRVRRKGCRGGERDLAPQDCCVVEGVRVTTALRTALDLGCNLHRADALAALDGFMRVGGVKSEDLIAELPRFRGRRGVVQLRRLVPVASPLAESPGESWTRMAILDEGIPTPQLQYWVIVDGVRRYRLDMAYPRSRVAVEFDGREFHDSPARRAADEKRRAWLRQHRWTVIVVRAEELSSAARRSWIDELKTALRLV